MASLQYVPVPIVHYYGILKSMFVLSPHYFLCAYTGGRICISGVKRVANSILAAVKKISVMHVIKLGFAPVSFPPG